MNKTILIVIFVFTLLINGLLAQNNILDKLPPTCPQIDSVSVINGKAVFSWFPNTDGVTKGYIILKRKNDASLTIDSIAKVYGVNSTTYTDVNSLTNIYNETYTIKAYDTNNIKSIYNEKLHSTILLKATVDNCLKGIDLSWTHYVNMTGGLKSYSIFVKEEDLNFVKVDEVAAEVNTYSVKNLKAKTNYEVYVRANSNNPSRTSTSNIIKARIYNYIAPTMLRITNVDVVDNAKVTIKFSFDNNTEVNRFVLFRTSNPNGAYDSITSISRTNINIYNLEFEDYGQLFKERSTYYKVVAKDSCKYHVKTSNVDNTVYVKASEKTEYVNLIQWNLSDSIKAKYNYIRIYRKLKEEAFVSLAILPINTEYYEDNIVNILNFDGSATYYIQIYDDYLNERNSNYVNVLRINQIYMPNAFVPSGTNNVFIPIFKYENFSNYRMRIYNKLGELVFQTNDTATGWDGNYNGAAAPQGGYIYEVIFTNSNGDTINKKGTLSLIR